MNFTYPIFLWGLVALAIPIIVHLFNFRKAKRVSFSNVRFLESIKKKTSSNLRLRHLLILLCRLLFIFFLILTFAQPFIPSNEDGLQNKLVSIFIDNSNSLSNLSENDISGFNELLGVAQEIVNLYPTEVQFNLLSNDFVPGTNTQLSKKKALEKLTEMEFSNLSRSGAAILDKLQNNKEKGDIFILSDFQRSTTGLFKPIIDSINEFHLIQPILSSNANIFVDTLFLTNPFLVPNQKNSIQVKVRNQGPAINDLQVKFFIDENQSGTTSLDIESNASETITFEVAGQLSKFNTCRISFEDFPITFDNDYFFTLNQASKIKIVEISDQKNSSVHKVYESNELFTIRTFHSENISYPTLEQADLIIVNAIDQIANGLKAQIEKHLQEGKSVIFIPKGGEILSYQFAGVQFDKKVESNKTPLDIPDIRDPFFENIFESINKETLMPDVTTMYQWQSQETKLLKTKSGQSFLSHLYNKGNLFVLAGPLDDENGNLHEHALFVPVMHRIAESSSSNNPALAFNIDQTNISIPVDSIPNGILYKLKNATSELIPSQRIAANELILDMPKYLLKPGYYDLMLGEIVISSIAFNHSKKESLLERLSLEEAQANLSGIKNMNMYSPKDAAAFSKNMKEKYHRRELWKYTLILSLIFLFAESVLIRFL